jgi:hypothetical protein
MKAEELPRTALDKCQILSSRTELLSVLPVDGVVAELGVDEGLFSQQIIEHCDPQILHLVDTWADKRFNDTKRKGVVKRFESELTKGTVEIHRMKSTEAVHKFENQSLDVVYIDTDHSYETTYQELVEYAKKVKVGGYLAGHDYIQGNWIDMQRYGVREAVSRFLNENRNWIFAYLTMEVTEPPSFALKKIRD